MRTIVASGTDPRSRVPFRLDSVLASDWRDACQITEPGSLPEVDNTYPEWEDRLEHEQLSQRDQTRIYERTDEIQHIVRAVEMAMVGSKERRPQSGRTKCAAAKQTEP